MRHVLALIVAIALLTGCMAHRPYAGPRPCNSAVALSAGGAGAGALLDRNNPWRGAVYGTLLGLSTGVLMDQCW